MTFDVNLLPATTGDHNLGSSDKKWNLYVNQINGVSPVTGVKGAAESTYRTGQVNLTAANIGAIAKNEIGNTQQLARPEALNGVNDLTIQPLINDVRANRLAFLPPDQIIIEQTIDGGNTWTDAGFTDGQKANLFSEKRQSPILIPLIDGEININCGLRITITAMKYNVPANTPEIQKYNYWNSNYVQATERYCQLKNMYFWVSSGRNSIKVKIERASGAASTNWITAFDKNDYGMIGWSGNDFITFKQDCFGGNISQTSQFWNYRMTLMTSGPNGSTELDSLSLTSQQNVMEIRGYGDGLWTKANEYMASDHLYGWDYNQNAIFPAAIRPLNDNSQNLGISNRKWANVYATTFIGALSGNASTATAFSADKSITLTGDVTGSASSTGGWNISTTVKAMTLNGGRIATPNVTHTQDDYSKLYYRIVSDVMNASGLKPKFSATGATPAIHDGFLLEAHWDNSTQCVSQLALNNVQAALSIRALDHSTWTDWVPILTSANVVTGDNDGEIKAGGTAVKVKGLGALAYKDSLAKGDVGLGSVDNTADNTKTVKYANMLTGFSSRSDSMTWGNQTGTVITYLASSNGGGWGFRDNNPASGQLSMTIDGTIYIKEGSVNIGDAVKSFSVSGRTVTYTTLWGNTGTFTTQDTTSADTKNTAGATDSTSKLYLIGATSQDANPVTNSYQYTYTNNGLLSALKVGLNLNGTEKVRAEWNNTDQCIDFVFN